MLYPPSLGREFDVSSDVELCSELTSATQPDVLPTLSDRDVEGMECVESYLRQARKRPSRRKTNRRCKKFRYISTRDSSSVHRKLITMAAAPQQPLPLGVVRTSSKEMPSSPHCGCSDGSRLTRTRSFRRLKHSRRGEEEDPLFCCFSDTSVALDLDTPPVSAKGNHMEWVESMFETAPLTIEEELMCEDTLLNESELSESTSDRWDYFCIACCTVLYCDPLPKFTLATCH